MRQRLSLTVLGAVFALMVTASACGGDEGGGATGTTSGTGATGATVGTGGDAIDLTIADLAFDPATLSLSGPTDVTITNQDATTHTFTTDDGGTDVEIEGGQSMTVTVDVSATTGFACRIHPSMTGTLEVS
jgi:plastocyanin